MSAELLALTLDIAGKIMVAYAAMQVHRRFWKEHRVDERVFKAMKREQIIGIFGIILMIVGFIIQVSDSIFLIN